VMRRRPEAYHQTLVGTRRTSPASSGARSRASWHRRTAPSTPGPPRSTTS
jgi:hypothetical protein